MTSWLRTPSTTLVSPARVTSRFGPREREHGGAGSAAASPAAIGSRSPDPSAVEASGILSLSGDAIAEATRITAARRVGRPALTARNPGRSGCHRTPAHGPWSASDESVSRVSRAARRSRRLVKRVTMSSASSWIVVGFAGAHALSVAASRPARGGARRGPDPPFGVVDVRRWRELEARLWWSHFF